MSKRFWLILAVALVLGIPILGILQGNRLMLDRYQNQVMMDSKPSQGVTEPAPYVDRTVAEDAFITQEGMAKTEMDMSSMVSTDIYQSGGFTQTTDRTVIKTAFLTLLVKDTRAAVNQVTQIVTQESGIVSSSNLTEDGAAQNALTAYLTLRVPVASLESSLEKIRGVAERVTSESTSSLDATEQKIDLDAQIANLRTTETQLQRLMTQSQNLSQTLEVQRELTTVRGQIERLVAQSENLQGDAEMATINLTISTQPADLPYIGGGEASLWEELSVALRDAVRLYRELFVGGLRLVILGLPLILLAGVGYALWSRWGKPKA